MIQISFIGPDGSVLDLGADVGQSLMTAAKNAAVPGIEATCGGACACATCHVYVDPAWFGKLPPATEDERDMLEFADAVRDNSRLSCQIMLEPSLDGLVVLVPESQG